MPNRMFIGRTCAMLLILTLLQIVSATTAYAHKRTELDDGYAVVVGWLAEPPLVGERNAITIDVERNGQPVEGVEATLDALVLYGGGTFRANLNPTATPGLYTVEIIPTIRGQFEIQLFGEIESLAVDLVTEPEEVLPANRLQFPESEPSGLEIQEQVTLLEGQLATARLIAIGGAILGLLGLVVGGLAWRKKA